jgi:hypothetical protein
VSEFDILTGNWQLMDTAFHAYGMAAFTRILGMSEEDADKVCSDALSAARNKNFHTYGH